MGNIYHFGMAFGHLPVRRTQKIAKKHGAELVNYTEPGSGVKRHTGSIRRTLA